MNNTTMTIYCRLIDGKRMINDLASSLNLFDTICNGNPGPGFNDEAFRISEEIVIKNSLILEIYVASMINMVYGAGLTDNRLTQFELYDFLIGYTGETTNTEGLPAKDELIRKMGSDWRKKHDELLKKEQGK